MASEAVLLRRLLRQKLITSARLAPQRAPSVILGSPRGSTRTCSLRSSFGIFIHASRTRMHTSLGRTGEEVGLTKYTRGDLCTAWKQNSRQKSVQLFNFQNGARHAGIHVTNTPQPPARTPQPRKPPKSPVSQTRTTRQPVRVVLRPPVKPHITYMCHLSDVITVYTQNT